MPFALALLASQPATSLSPGLIDLEQAYATAASRMAAQTAARDEGGLTPIEDFNAAASAILLGCCADLCIDVGCRICADACFASLPPSLQAAWSGAVTGAVAGCFLGTLIGIIPGLITAVISFSLSVGAVGPDDASGAALASYSLTNSLFGLIGLGVGGVVGAGAGFFYGEDLLTQPDEVQPANERPNPPSEKPDGYGEDEIPPPESFDDDNPPEGDAPPPPGVRF